MSQTSKVSKNNTVVLNEAGVTTIILYKTPVVTIDENKRTVTFNNGGWITATTQTRMTQVCREYGLAYNVGRKKGVMSIGNFCTGESFDMDSNTITLPLKYSAWDANAGKHYEQA